MSTGQWLPIETAPKDGSRFLAILKNGEYEIMYLNEKMHQWSSNGRYVFGFIDNALAWMPLPPPPGESP